MNIPKKYTKNPRALRLALGLNQVQFWNAVGVTQSGGSRYETGRDIPVPVQVLLVIAYGARGQASRIIHELRT